MTLRKVQPAKVIDEKYELGEQCLVPFWAGNQLSWEIQQ